MPNMHYCRFHNTRGDLNACIEAMAERETLSKDEHRAATRMLQDFIGFLAEEGIIEEVNEDRLDALLKDMEGGE